MEIKFHQFRFVFCFWLIIRARHLFSVKMLALHKTIPIQKIELFLEPKILLLQLASQLEFLIFVSKLL